MVLQHLSRFGGLLYVLDGEPDPKEITISEKDELGVLHDQLDKRGPVLNCPGEEELLEGNFGVQGELVELQVSEALEQWAIGA